MKKKKRNYCLQRWSCLSFLVSVVLLSKFPFSTLLLCWRLYCFCSNHHFIGEMQLLQTVVRRPSSTASYYLQLANFTSMQTAIYRPTFIMLDYYVKVGGRQVNANVVNITSDSREDNEDMHPCIYERRRRRR